METFKKTLSIISYIFIGFIIIINLIVITTRGILKQDYPIIFGYSYFEIASNSMYPELKKGDIVVVKLSNENIKKGDIITFKDDSFYTTHRIEKIKDNIVTTKGDANNVSDDEITKNDIVGKVIFKLRYLGILISIIKKPITIFLAFLLLIVTSFIRKK